MLLYHPTYRAYTDFKVIGMMRLTLTLMPALFSATLFAASSCPQAVATDDPGFCSSFQYVAQCHCRSSGLPQAMCQDMGIIYKRMIIFFGSVLLACEYQHDTTRENCIDFWDCYNNGGVDSQGRLCSGSGRSCR